MNHQTVASRQYYTEPENSSKAPTLRPVLFSERPDPQDHKARLRQLIRERTLRRQDESLRQLQIVRTNSKDSNLASLPHYFSRSPKIRDSNYTPARSADMVHRHSERGISELSSRNSPSSSKMHPASVIDTPLATGISFMTADGSSAFGFPSSNRVTQLEEQSPSKLPYHDTNSSGTQPRIDHTDFSRDQQGHRLDLQGLGKRLGSEITAIWLTELVGHAISRYYQGQRSELISVLTQATCIAEEYDLKGLLGKSQLWKAIILHDMGNTANLDLVLGDILTLVRDYGDEMDCYQLRKLLPSYATQIWRNLMVQGGAKQDSHTPSFNSPKSRAAFDAWYTWQLTTLEEKYDPQEWPDPSLAFQAASSSRKRQCSPSKVHENLNIGSKGTLLGTGSAPNQIMAASGTADIIARLMYIENEYENAQHVIEKLGEHNKELVDEVNQYRAVLARVETHGLLTGLRSMIGQPKEELLDRKPSWALSPAISPGQITEFIEELKKAKPRSRTTALPYVQDETTISRSGEAYSHSRLVSRVQKWRDSHPQHSFDSAASEYRLPFSSPTSSRALCSLKVPSSLSSWLGPRSGRDLHNPRLKPQPLSFRNSDDRVADNFVQDHSDSFRTVSLAPPKQKSDQRPRNAQPSLRRDSPAASSKGWRKADLTTPPDQNKSSPLPGRNEDLKKTSIFSHDYALKNAEALQSLSKSHAVGNINHATRELPGPSGLYDSKEHQGGSRYVPVVHSQPSPLIGRPKELQELEEVTRDTHAAHPNSGMPSRSQLHARRTSLPSPSLISPLTIDPDTSLELTDTPSPTQLEAMIPNFCKHQERRRRSLSVSISPKTLVPPEAERRRSEVSEHNEEKSDAAHGDVDASYGDRDAVSRPTASGEYLEQSTVKGDSAYRRGNGDELERRSIREDASIQTGDQSFQSTFSIPPSGSANMSISSGSLIMSPVQTTSSTSEAPRDRSLSDGSASMSIRNGRSGESRVNSASERRSDDSVSMSISSGHSPTSLEAYVPSKRLSLGNGGISVGRGIPVLGASSNLSALVPEFKPSDSTYHGERAPRPDAHVTQSQPDADIPYTPYTPHEAGLKSEYQPAADLDKIWNTSIRNTRNKSSISDEATRSENRPKTSALPQIQTTPNGNSPSNPFSYAQRRKDPVPTNPSPLRRVADLNENEESEEDPRTSRAKFDQDASRGFASQKVDQKRDEHEEPRQLTIRDFASSTPDPGSHSAYNGWTQPEPRTRENEPPSVYRTLASPKRNGTRYGSTPMPIDEIYNQIEDGYPSPTTPGMVSPSSSTAMTNSDDPYPSVRIGSMPRQNTSFLRRRRERKEQQNDVTSQTRGSADGTTADRDSKHTLKQDVLSHSTHIKDQQNESSDVHDRPQQQLGDVERDDEPPVKPAARLQDHTVAQSSIGNSSNRTRADPTDGDFHHHTLPSGVTKKVPDTDEPDRSQPTEILLPRIYSPNALPHRYRKASLVRRRSSV